MSTKSLIFPTFSRNNDVWGVWCVLGAPSVKWGGPVVPFPPCWEAPSAHCFRPSCSGIRRSWPAAQTLQPREILEASGIIGRTPLPLTAPRACSRRSQSCREVGSNRVRHARRSYPRARLGQRACRQRPPHSGQVRCALRRSRGRNQSIFSDFA